MRAAVLLSPVESKRKKRKASQQHFAATTTNKWTKDSIDTRQKLSNPPQNSLELKSEAIMIREIDMEYGVCSCESADMHLAF